METVEEPVTVETVEEPVTVETVEEPVTVETVEEPVTVETVEELVLVDTVDEPDLIENENIEKINNQTSEEPIYLEKKNTLEEVQLNLEEITDTVEIKERNDLYYQMYREAKKKGKIARDLALSSFLEARRIKKTYMLEDISDSEESDLDNEEIEH